MVIKSANRQIRIPKYREFPGSQWSGLHTFTAEVSDSIPSQGNKTPQALQHSLPPPPKKKKTKYEMLQTSKAQQTIKESQQSGRKLPEN